MPVASVRSLIPVLCMLAFPFTAISAPDGDEHYHPGFGIGVLEGIAAKTGGTASVVAVDSQWVYFGGVFGKVCGYRANNIIRYHKKTGRFERLGTENANGTNGEVVVIKIVQGGVHVGGKFSKVGVDTAQAGGTETGPYAYFDGKDWKPAGPKIGFYNSAAAAAVTAIQFDGGETYIGGVFSLVGKDTIFNIARYKGGNAMEPLWEQGHLTNGVTTIRPQLYITGIRVTQSSVVVAGNITIAGGANVNRVAMWNKNLEKWDGMKGGLDVPPTSLYISDMDQDDNGRVMCAYQKVHRYDDTGWTILPGMDSVKSVHRFLYKTPFGSMIIGNGGDHIFDSSSIAFFDGNAWKWKGPSMRTLGYTATGAYGVAADDKYLWLGTSGGVMGAEGMAFYDGARFGALGNGLRVTRDGGLGFQDFVEFEGKIIAAGSFSHLGNTAAEGLARWTGETWEAMGSEFQSAWRLAVFKGKLYACGSLQKKGQPVSGGLARYTGTGWEIVPGFEKSNVEALAATETHLWMAGTGIGTTGQPMGRWDGSTLEELGKELTSSSQIGINGIVPRGPGSVCVSGYFNKVNGMASAGAACYDGASRKWTGLGAAFANGTYASNIAGIGDDLYLGMYGNFPSGAKNIARWDGKDWVEVGGGLDKGVQRFAANGSDLYVVGVFTKAGDVPASGVARWDGKAWSALGSGVSPANAVSVYVGAGGLWLGGNFTMAGGIPSRQVALYGNVERKAALPIAIRPAKAKAGKAIPKMRVTGQKVEFGAPGEARNSAGRALRTSP